MTCFSLVRNHWVWRRDGRKQLVHEILFRELRDRQGGGGAFMRELNRSPDEKAEIEAPREGLSRSGNGRGVTI